VIVQSYTK